jgi:hypothetical protein
MTATATDSAIASTTLPAKRRSTKASEPPRPPILDIKTILVTPQQAKKWLASNAEDNRHRRPRKIAAFARDMIAGKWQITGDTVKITGDGVLIDGQHRLQAVVDAQVSVYMVVAFDVPHGAMAVIDTGTARTFADNLRGTTIAHRMECAAVVRRVAIWDRGNRMGKGVYDTPTHAELLARFNDDSDSYVTAAARGADVNRAGLASAGAAGTAFYLFARIDKEQANQYFDHLVTGANLPAKHPILTVRNRLNRAAKRREDRLQSPEQLALLIRGWNAFREDRELDRTILAKVGNLNTKNFPAPV